ncbi:Hypothetical protein CINCED_3A023271 [Cinara cedri]|uniref:Coiled-coil domain-containing protein 40 n=1 Tax=Cinara cedri TaxID=506608 RepID=A0A5E4LYU8_9HEMI|nr:Hypothetical protein CINCED_3A023271 [Cinara cedri]
MENNNYKLSDEEKSIHNEIENDIPLEDSNRFRSIEPIQDVETLSVQNEFEHVFIEDPNGIMSHQSIQYPDSNSDLVEAKSETSMNDSESISKDLESVNSEITSINKETINNQMIVLEPDNPIMMRFQNRLKQHLLKQKENIKKELLTQEGIVRLKQNEKSSLIFEVNNATFRVENQHSLLGEFHRMKLKLEEAKEQVETYITQGKCRYNEISTKTTEETKKLTALKRKLDCGKVLLNELIKYEKEQEDSFTKFNQKKSQVKQQKKKLFNEHQKQTLLLMSLKQEIMRLEEYSKQLGEQAETKYNERELLNQIVMDNSTDLDTINEENTKITLLWNDVLIHIQQQDKSFQNIKNNFHYNHSTQEEFLRNYDLTNVSNKLKREQIILQNSFKLCLEEFENLKQKYSKLIQMIEFQQQNLNQVLIELLLVGIEKNLSEAILKLEQFRNTSYNLEKNIEENTKRLNEGEIALSALDSELKKIYTEIRNKTRQIDTESKQLETFKIRMKEGTDITPQMQIKQVRHTINDVEKEIDFIKESWIQKQNQNVKLLDQRNKQFNEINDVCKYISILDTKNVKIELEIVSLSKESDNFKRILANLRNTIMKLGEHFNENKEKSTQLLNENEWMQCSHIAELKENERQCQEHMTRLKSLKNELGDMKNAYAEKLRESRSWDSKVQSIIEMKKEIQKKEGDSGDIDVIKNEIHRMQIRESQLKKNLEIIMLDLETCISRREMIYNKAAAKDVRLKGKNEARQKFVRKMDALRLNIKKIKMECKKLDRIMNDLEHSKMELESKIAYADDRLNEVHKNINDLIKNIEDICATKTKNIHNLSYKQSHAKLLDEVKEGKYRLLIQNESKMNEVFEAERKKNTELISVAEALKNDFPDLDFQLTHLLDILKTIEN